MRVSSFLMVNTTKSTLIEKFLSLMASDCETSYRISYTTLKLIIWIAKLTPSSCGAQRQLEALVTVIVGQSTRVHFGTLFRTDDYAKYSYLKTVLPVKVAWNKHLSILYVYQFVRLIAFGQQPLVLLIHSLFVRIFRVYVYTIGTMC